MTETTLLIRHLPKDLSQDERKDLLHHVGATQVRLMGRNGHMKHTAFAVFPSKEKASQVIDQLHQTEFLGSTLVLEFAHKDNSNIPSVVDNEGIVAPHNKDEKADDASGIADTDMRKPREIRYDSTFRTWGLEHPRPSRLKYLYPPPSQAILTNIMHALACVPKLYVQVLHLMNKMDLPAPFGVITPPPPIAPGISSMPAQPDDVSQREMDISTSSESELDTDSGDDRRNNQKRAKEKQRPALKKQRPHKRPRLSDLHDGGGRDLGLSSAPSAPPLPVSQVFEKSSEPPPSRKIELKISAALNPATTGQTTEGQKSGGFPTMQQRHASSAGPTHALHDPHVPHAANAAASSYSSNVQNAPGASNPPSLYLTNAQSSSYIPNVSIATVVPNIHSVSSDSISLTQTDYTQRHPQDPTATTTTAVYKETSSESRTEAIPHLTETRPEAEPLEAVVNEKDGDQDSAPGSFGVMHPKPKDQSHDDEDEVPERSWGHTKFISSSQLRKSRLSDSEMSDLSVFRRYSAGDPSCRLYIKNLAKIVTEEDLHWVYGRYINWDIELETNTFDIMLMKQGRMKGQAFITFPNEDAAKMARKDTNGFLLKDKPMVVQFARSAKAEEDKDSKL